MCKLQIENNGYKLKGGKIVTPDKLEDLNKDELEELLSTNISAWEFLMLRKSNHHLVNAINGLTGSMQERIGDVEGVNKSIIDSLKRIEDSLTVEIQNGEKHKKKMAELVVELWNIHRKERDKKKLIQAVDKYKLPMLFITIFCLAISIKFHDFINQALQSAEDFLFVSITAGVVLSILGYLIKFVIEKRVKVNP